MLVIVRHGQTEANARGLLLGRSDPSLSDLGRRQARALAGSVPATGRVVASPLARTVETAAAFGRPVEVDERWIELDYGALDGLPIGDVPAGVWHEWRRDPEYVPSGGESLLAVGRRVREACEELAAEAAAGDVTVVSHVSPIKAAIAWALGVGDEVAWRMFVQVGSIARLRLDQRGPTLLAFNEVPDLDGHA
jgi:broad specificity phosphatase PhoE